jgi:hypothetical protein
VHALLKVKQPMHGMTYVVSRIAQIERGEVETVPWEDVEAKIRRTLSKSRCFVFG